MKLPRYMATCTELYGLLTCTGQASQLQFCNGIPFLDGPHRHRQPFRLCQVPYLQKVFQIMKDGKEDYISFQLSEFLYNAVDGDVLEETIGEFQLTVICLLLEVNFPLT